MARAFRRERWALYLAIVAASAAIGAGYGAAIAPGDSPLAGPAIGALNGALIAGGIGGIELFLLRSGAAFIRRLPFAALLGLKTLVYTALFAAVPAAHLSGLVLPALMGGSPVDVRTELATVGLSVLLALAGAVAVQSASLVGPQALLDLTLGRYRRPRLQRRFFLFVDVVGSTRIAERLGPREAHRLLGRLFSAVAEPISAHRGEIYQYVGDQIVVTWTEDAGAREARPVRCFFAMQRALEDGAARFRRRFGVVPGIRAALHLGEVVAGEIGELRRAIVFHGDAVNAAARLEQAARELGLDFVVSDDALRALGGDAGAVRRDLGALALRGREAPVRAWALAARL